MKLQDLPVLKMEFLVTRRCQLRCKYCKITDSSKLWALEMDTRQAISCINLMADNWPGAPIIIYGGEPTTRPDLPELIDHTRFRGVKHAVISNSLKVINDEPYAKELVDAGLSNWSISFDGYTDAETLGKDAFRKSNAGLSSLLMMRDKFNIKDLVACITVSRKNIDDLPAIVANLSYEGIWAICTPLQMGGVGYDYAQGARIDLPSQYQLATIAPIMESMASSGRFLMHNGPEWFRVWPESFRNQVWMCHDKSVLTVDADGSLRYCVDIQLPEPIFAWELNDPKVLDQYVEWLKKKPNCEGCFWDPCYEGTYRALSDDYGIEKGRESFRHELTEERISQLLPEAQKHFRRKTDGE